MKTAKIFLLISLPILFLLQGCLTTLHPFFFDTDIVENENLFGQWNFSEGNNKGILQIEKIPQIRYNELSGDIKKNVDKGYLITWKDSANITTAQYFAFLAKINNNYYFDYYPAETELQKNINSIYKLHYIKLHTCYKVSFKDAGEFEIRLFDQGFTEKLLDERKILIKHEKQATPDNRVIITASTVQLREYLTKYGNNQKAYGDTYTCKKIIL